MLDFSKLIGWLGFSFGMFISVPQVIKSIRTRSTQGVSKLTYILLLLACICYVVRAIAIKEMIFIVSNAFQIVVAGTMLYLMRKYKRKFKSVDLGKHWEFNRKEIYETHLHAGTDDKKHPCHTQGCEICNPSIMHIKKTSEDLNVKT